MNSSIKNFNRIFGLICYTGLFLLSIVFYKERTIFMDISFHVFSLVQENDFAIQNFRFGALFTQILPLIAVKLSLPLKYVLIFYSVSFVLFHFLGWLIITFLVRNWRFGLIIIALSIGITTHTFYWIQSELHQGLVLLVIYFSIIDFSNEKKILNSELHFPIECVLLFFLAFVHPMIIIPFTFFSILFMLIHKGEFRAYLYRLVTFIIMYFIKSRFFKTDYDSKSLGGLKNFKSFFPDYLGLESNQKFATYLIQDYYFLVVGLIFILILIVKNINRKPAFIILCFTLGLILLVNVTFPDGVVQFYVENLYLATSLFIAFGFIYLSKDFITKQKSKPTFKMLYIVFSIFLIIRFYNIYDTGQLYKDRLDWLRDYAVENTGAKKIVNSINLPHDKLLMTWASPYEFWLLTTLEKQKTESFIFHKNPKALIWVNDRSDQFLTAWGAYKYEDLNPKYFNFNDSQSKYTIEE